MPLPLKITLAFLALVLLCAGIPYGCLYTITPVKHTYQPHAHEKYIPGYAMSVFLRGDADLAGHDSGPRTIYFNLTRSGPGVDTPVRLIQASATSSISGPLAVYTPGALPTDMPFGLESDPNWSHWHGDQLFDADLANDDIITVTITIEVTTDQGPTTHTLEGAFTPRHRHPIFSQFLPSV